MESAERSTAAASSSAATGISGSAGAAVLDRPAMTIWPDQEFGAGRSLKSRFRHYRKNRNGFENVRMHQLSRRLEKLLYDGPNVSMLGKAAGAKVRTLVLVRDCQRREADLYRIVTRVSLTSAYFVVILFQ